MIENNIQEDFLEDFDYISHQRIWGGKSSYFLLFSGSWKNNIKQKINGSLGNRNRNDSDQFPPDWHLADVLSLSIIDEPISTSKAKFELTGSHNQHAKVPISINL